MSTSTSIENKPKFIYISPMKNGTQEIGDYLILQTIGSGATGKVKLGEHKVTHELAAIKIFKKSVFDSKPELEQKIQRETALMRLLEHPHLLKLKEFCESPRHIYIILEYAAHGELFDYLMARRALSVEMAMKFFRQIIYGLDYLHSHNICHRDLKPENILLDENDNVKIADFGFARWMNANTAETSCGSPHYASPEIVKGIPYDGRKADIWSCGVILYALLSGRLPFDDPSFRNLVAKIKAGQYRMPDFPPEIKDLISRILTVDPEKRITLEQIKHHKAFRIELPRKYTVPTPLPRPTNIDPMTMDEVDPLVISILHNIGFSKEELPGLLQETGFNQAKYFTFLLTQQLSLENLPWTAMESDEKEDSILLSDTTDSSVSTPTPLHPHDDEAFYVEGGVPINGSFVMRNQDQFARNKRSEIANSMVVYSMIEKAEYISPLFPSSEEKVETITGISAQLETVFGEIQSHLIKLDYDWFYPNEMCLFAHRNVIDPNSYYILEAEYENEEQFKLSIKVQGNDDRLNEFYKDIQQVISAIAI